MALTEDAWRFWAKTPSRWGADGDIDQVGTREWLSLPQHMRDSADVGGELFTTWLPEQAQAKITAVCEDDSDAARALVAFLAGSHDLGKAERVFQAQIQGSREFSWLWDEVSAMPWCRPIPGFVPEPRPQHAEVSDAIQRRYLRNKFPHASMGAIVSVTSISGCHHGRLRPLGHGEHGGAPRLQELNRWLDRHGDRWAQLWDELLDDVLERTGAAAVLRHVLDAGGLPISQQMLLAGLVTMSDWIASNQNLFPLSEDGRHLSDASRATKGMEKLGLTRAWIPDSLEIPPFRERFGWPGAAQLRPCQEAAVRAAQAARGPSLMIIEEEMGQGKTEAALLAAEILASRRGSGGVVFALPTMATTDSMFSRVQSWVTSLVGENVNDRHSMFLGHSRSWLNRDYEHLIRATRAVGEHGEEAVVAHQWFTGRRGMLSEFVVCTIDQVLMAALATRYVTLRHLGLAGKVVILDEVHAYDIYTSSYMQRALTWLAAHGTSVILLSATLESGLRRQLENAYVAGLGGDPRPEPSAPFSAEPEQLRARKGRRGRRREVALVQEPSTPAYPRVTLCHGDGVQQHPIAPRATHRVITLVHVPDDPATLHNVLAAFRSDGGVVGIVCNTVRRAQMIYEHLRQEIGPDDLELIHSQFTAADRATREAQLVIALGPESHRDSGRPWRRIVVGTQVLEQSLDIDFDVLITDLAPGDAVAQRAGRLHRHVRPESDRPTAFREPTVYVRGVDVSGEVPIPAKESSFIYGDRVLLATWAAFQPILAGRTWCLTHELEPLIERIYARDMTVPGAWQKAYEDAAAQEYHHQAASRKNAEAFQVATPMTSHGHLSAALANSTVKDTGSNETAVAAQVRDIDPTLEVLLVQEVAGLLRPLPGTLTSPGQAADSVLSESVPPPWHLARAVAASSIRLPRWLVPPWSLDAAIDELERCGIKSWQQDFRLRGQLVVRLDQNNRGSILGRRFGYNSDIGIHEVVDEPDDELYDEDFDFDEGFDECEEFTA